MQAYVSKRAPSRKKRYPILFRNHPGVPDFVNFPKKHSGKRLEYLLDTGCTQLLIMYDFTVSSYIYMPILQRPRFFTIHNRMSMVKIWHVKTVDATQHMEYH